VRNYLVVIDPTCDNQPALNRAEQLATNGTVSLHLFCCVYRKNINDFSSRKEAKHSAIVNAKVALVTMAKRLRNGGITVTTEVIWNQRWQEAIVQACSRIAADLVIKTSSEHSALQRQMQKTSDYTLLRQSPCAVLLVKSDTPWTHKRVLAAVAFTPAKDGHAQLNNLIINAAQRLARETASQLHIATAITQETDISGTLTLLDEDDDAESDEALIGEHYGTESSHVHIQTGKAKRVICDICTDINADLVVIGTVAHKGVTGIMIGNTAEKILDDIAIDVLVVN